VLIFLISQLRPEADFSDELGPPVIRDSWKGSEDQQSSITSRNGSALPRFEPFTTLHPYPVDTASPFSQYRVPPPLIRKHSRRKPSRPREEDVQASSESESDSSTSSKDTECERLQALIQYAATSSDSPTTSAAIRYHGRSSQTSLIKMTRQLKQLRLQELTSSNESSREHHLRPEFWSSLPVGTLELVNFLSILSIILFVISLP
jgi:hypothetical protein